LHGVKVADFTAFWAGPAATHALACLGAEVIKVESVQRPDGMRFTSCKPRDERWWEWSAVFHGVNTNKRSVTLKLDDHRGRELALQLVEWADVVIENYSPRVMEQFELDWAVISSRNPRAIMLRLPAFGLTGPWRDRPGFAMTVEQMSGLAWQTGYQDGPPMDVGGVCDPLGGMHAVVALIAGLAERQRRGTGMLIEVPLLEVALNVAAEHVLQFSANGAVLPRLGNRSADAAPQGVYACAGADAWVAVSVMNDRQWMSLCRVLELDDLRDDKALEVVEGRRREHARIDRALAGRFRCMASGDAEARLTGAGVPAAAVPVPVDVIGNPQLAARGFFEAVDHPVVGRYRLPSLPVVVGRVARRWHRTPPPTLGQHNDEVIRGLLGVAEEELRTLENEGVVGTAPVTT
jgi:crotonobetainyl-CoA:carnitine CoA-transferase CaiB-like acyl-CoA transferase